MKHRPFNNPFAVAGKALKKDLEARAGEDERTAAAQREMEARARREAARRTEVEASDDELFSSAMRGAAPIRDDGRGVIKPELPPGDASHVPIRDEEAEVLAELASLVNGEAHFDIADSDEFVEGCVEGLDRRVLRRLKAGEYSIAAHLDLHGLRRDEAREEVESFLAKARANSQRCVLIVTGRGLRSKDQIPVLKLAVKSWLERGRIARGILAFSSARPHDGGAGALYVLLRR